MSEAPAINLQWYEQLSAECLADVNRECAVVRRTWLALLAVQAYLVVALAGVTQLDLFVEAPLTLPLINSRINQSAFFIFAPLVLLVQQMFLVQQVATLSRKIRHLNQTLMAYELGSPYGPIRHRELLSSFFLAQCKAGPLRHTILARIKATAWLSVVHVLPLVLLVAFLVRTLPLHDDGMTWLLRGYVLLGLLTHLYAVRATAGEAAPPQSSTPLSSMRAPAVSLVVRGAFVAAWLFISLCVATLPDEAMDRLMRSIWPVPVPAHTGELAPSGRQAFALTAMLFEGPLDPRSGKSRSPFARNIELTDTVASGLPGSKLVLRGRDLRYARLDRSVFKDADFSLAQLFGASLAESVMTGAHFTRTDLRNSLLIGTDLSSAVIFLTDFTGSTLIAAKFDNVKFHCDKVAVCGLAKSRIDNVTGLPSELAETLRQIAQQRPPS